MATILISEISETGHHPRYVRHVLESIDFGTTRVLVAGTRNLLQHCELDEARNRFEPIQIEVTKTESQRLCDFSRSGLVRRQFCVRSIYARVWRELSQTQMVDLVIVPFLDDCRDAFALAGSPFGQTPWVCVSMRTQFHLSAVGVIVDKKRGSGMHAQLFRRLLRQPSLKALLTIDPTLAHFAQNRKETEFAKVQYLPDPCESLAPISKAEARRSVGLPADCKAILVYGALGERKGISQLIRAMSLPECPEEIHLIVAGSQYESVRLLLETPAATALIAANRLHIVSGYIPINRVAELVYASDAMWIAYIDFYTMSGVLVLAARHGLPCLTTQQGIVGYLSRMHNCGVQVDPRSEESIIDVFQRIARGDSSLDRAAENAKFAFSDHSHAEFYRVFGNSVRMAADTTCTA